MKAIKTSALWFPVFLCEPLCNSTLNNYTELHGVAQRIYETAPSAL